MNIKYNEGSRSIEDKYIKFRLDFIIKFSNILLPLKINNERNIKAKLYNYYILSRFEKIDFDKMINESNSSLKQIFINNNIRIKEIQDLCFSIIDTTTLFNWKEQLTNSDEIKEKKSLIDLATTIYIAQLYEKFLFLKENKKMSFEDVNRSIINKLKGIIDVDLLLKIKSKNKQLEKLYNETHINNSKFISSLNEYDIFRIKLSKIFNINNELLFISNLNYNIKDFEKDNKNEVVKISNRETIKTSLKRIELDFSSLFMTMSILSNTSFKLIIELNANFLSNKINTQYIINRFNILKNYIYISVGTDVVKKYEDAVNELKSHGFNIIMHLNEKNVEESNISKIISGIKYFIVEYSDKETFGKLLSKIRETKVIPIVKNVPNKNIVGTKKIEYYTINQKGDAK